MLRTLIITDRLNIRSAVSMLEPQILGEASAGILERHGPIDFPMDELAHERLGGSAHFLGGSVSHDAPVRDVINKIDELERLLYVMRDDDRSRAERVVEPPDEVADDTK